MKTRIILFAAAIMAIFACNKENEVIDNPSQSATAFREGQEVTIGVSSGKVSTKVTGTDDSANNKIDLTWEKGDSILVTVDNNKTAKFVLSSGAGTAEAEFTGKMPADGDDFDIQYPATTPNLSTQTYVAGKIPAGKISFEATGCSLEETADLSLANSILQLNLYGTSQTISKIVVTNVASEATYTLNISGGKTLGTTSETATPFFVVVPKAKYKISAAIYDNATTPAQICTFTTSTEQEFVDNDEAGKCVNMPAKKVAPILLPGKFSVSDTKKVQFTRGNLYYSSTDNAYHIEDEQNVTYATLGQTEYTASHVCHFFWTNLTDYQSGTAEYMPYASSYSYSSQSKSDKFWCCEENKLTVDGQSGLYALTGSILTEDSEWAYLIGREAYLYKYGVSVTTSSGTVEDCLVIAPDGYLGEIEDSYDAEAWANAESEEGFVCLPAAGRRFGTCLQDCGTYGEGWYWSATLKDDSTNSLYLKLKSSDIWIGDDSRSHGSSVRLVCAVQ